MFPSIDVHTLEQADKYSSLFVCEIEDNLPTRCGIEIPRRGRKSKAVVELESFIANIDVGMGDSSFPVLDLVFFVLNSYKPVASIATNEEGKIDARKFFAVMQDSCKRSFFAGGDKLMQWGINNQFWVNRSLKVIENSEQNSKMKGSDGSISLENIFRHAQNQFVYRMVYEITQFLNS